MTTNQRRERSKRGDAHADGVDGGITHGGAHENFNGSMLREFVLIHFAAFDALLLHQSVQIFGLTRVFTFSDVLVRTREQMNRFERAKRVRRLLRGRDVLRARRDDDVEVDRVGPQPARAHLGAHDEPHLAVDQPAHHVDPLLALLAYYTQYLVLDGSPLIVDFGFDDVPQVIPPGVVWTIFGLLLLPIL